MLSSVSVSIYCLSKYASSEDNVVQIHVIVFPDIDNIYAETCGKPDRKIHISELI